MEEDAASVMASLRIWFTTPVLLVLLNLTIGTIVLISTWAHRPRRSESMGDRRNAPFVASVIDDARSPGSLRRLGSGKIYNPPREPADPPPEPADPPPESVAPRAEDHHFVRSQSEPRPVVGGRPMTESAIVRAASLKGDVVRRRPAAARGYDWTAEEEVDAKAGDFIDRFRQQLRLQRFDSVVSSAETKGTNLFMTLKDKEDAN